jgi:hypothetical protein
VLYISYVLFVVHQDLRHFLCSPVCPAVRFSPCRFWFASVLPVGVLVLWSCSCTSQIPVARCKVAVQRGSDFSLRTAVLRPGLRDSHNVGRCRQSPPKGFQHAPWSFAPLGQHSFARFLSRSKSARSIWCSRTCSAPISPCCCGRCFPARTRSKCVVLVSGYARELSPPARFRLFP